MNNNASETAWLDELGEIVEDGQLHFYTRLTLLLISKGYQPTDFLAPGFGDTLIAIHWLPFERQFMQSFWKMQPKAASLDPFITDENGTIRPLSELQLQQILTADAKRAGFDLTLAKLRQDYLAK